MPFLEQFIVRWWELFALSRSWVWLERGTIIDSRRPTLCQTKAVAGAQWHRHFLWLNITVIPHTHGQGHDHWKLGSGTDEPLWPGAHIQLVVYPRLALRITIQYVSGHFSTAFCSTIGTVFVTDTFSHHSKPHTHQASVLIYPHLTRP